MSTGISTDTQASPDGEAASPALPQILQGVLDRKRFAKPCEAGRRTRSLHGWIHGVFANRFRSKTPPHSEN